MRVRRFDDGYMYVNRGDMLIRITVSIKLYQRKRLGPFKEKSSPIFHLKVVRDPTLPFLLEG